MHGEDKGQETKYKQITDKLRSGTERESNEEFQESLEFPYFMLLNRVLRANVTPVSLLDFSSAEANQGDSGGPSSRPGTPSAVPETSVSRPDTPAAAVPETAVSRPDTPAVQPSSSHESSGPLSSGTQTPKKRHKRPNKLHTAEVSAKEMTKEDMAGQEKVKR